MSLLPQISDTHFGTEQAQVVEALLALAAQQRPKLVVLSDPHSSAYSSHRRLPCSAASLCEDRQE